MNRVVNVGDDEKESSMDTDMEELKERLYKSIGLAFIAVISHTVSAFGHITTAAIKIWRISVKSLVKASGYVSQALKRVSGILPGKIREVFDNIERETDTILRLSSIFLGVAILSFSLTAFLGLNFYSSMTSQEAYVSMVNTTHDSGDTIAYGDRSWYGDTCDVSRVISSVEVPCDTLAGGMDSVIGYVADQKDVDREEVLVDVAERAYADSNIASKHQASVTLMPGAVALAAISALIISYRSRNVLEVFKRVGSANIISGFLLFALKSLLPYNIVDTAAHYTLGSSNVVVLANSISLVQPFRAQLFILDVVAIFLTFSGSILVLSAYYLEHKY